MRRDYYWPNMASDMYRVVSTCHSCDKSDTKLKHKSRVQFLLETRPLEVFAMGTFGFLLKTTKGNQPVVIISNRYSKLTRAVHIARIKMTAVACLFFDSWVFPYGIPSYVLTKNGAQFVRKCFGTVYLSRYKTHANACISPTD